MLTLSSEILERLREYQRASAQSQFALAREGKNTVNGSDTGTGKTFVEAAVASGMGCHTVVVCPKIAQSAWRRAAEHFGVTFEIVGYEKLRTGNTGLGHWDNRNPEAETYLHCTECLCKVVPGGFPCHVKLNGIHCVEVKKKPIRYGKFNFTGPKNIIFDEAHRCGGMDSLNADMLIAAKRQRIRVSMLSATLANSPLNLRAVGYALGLHNLDSDLIVAEKGRLPRRVAPSFDGFLRKQGCQWLKEFHGWKWMVGKDAQMEAMRALRSQIFPAHGVRLSHRDIPNFPKRTITAELYDLEEQAGRLNALYQEMADAVGRLHEKKKADLNEEHPLTKMLRARQEVELIKVPVLSELGEDYLATGNSVVLFVNFRETIDELAKRFPNFRIIDGRTLKQRDGYIAEFQANEVPGLIVQNEAGKESMSLQDLDGFHPRVGLVSPCQSANTMRQIFGRLQRDGGLSPCFYRVIFIDKTVEVPVHRSVAPKLDNLDALNDGDFEPANLKLM